jgi:hypothetical protein
MLVDVEICEYSNESVDNEMPYRLHAASSHRRSPGGWRGVLKWGSRVGGIGSVVLALFGHPAVLVVGTVVGTAVVLSVLVASGLLLWTSVYGDKVPREQAFRLMRLVSGRGEPQAPDFATFPLDVAKEADAHDSHHLGVSRAPAALEPHALIATVGRVRQRTEHDRERSRSSRIRCNAL